VNVSSLALVAGQVKGAPASTAAATGIPHWRKQGTAMQLNVDGKPYLALARADAAQGDFLAAWGDWKSGGWSGDTTGRGLNMTMRD